MTSPKKRMLWTAAAVAAAFAIVVAGVATAQQPVVKIGLLATLEGPFAAGGQDGMRGAELAVKQRGGTVAGKKIEIIRRRRTPSRTSRSTPPASWWSRTRSTSWSAALSSRHRGQNYSRRSQYHVHQRLVGAQATTRLVPRRTSSASIPRRAVDGGPGGIRVKTKATKMGADRGRLRVPLLAGAGFMTSAQGGWARPWAWVRSAAGLVVIASSPTSTRCWWSRGAPTL